MDQNLSRTVNLNAQGTLKKANTFRQDGIQTLTKTHDETGSKQNAKYFQTERQGRDLAGEI